MDFARTDRTPEQAAEAVGRRGGAAALASVPAGTPASEGPPQEPPATSGTARQRRQRVCTGFPGCFPFWGRLWEGCCRCCWGWLLLLCAGELSGSVGNGSRVEHRHAAGKPRGQPTGAPGRRGPAQRNFPRPADSAGRSRSPRRRHRAPRNRTPGPPPRGLPKATEGNHGESTGTGTGGNPQRPPTHKRESGQAPDRQQKQRVSADSSCVFLFGRGVWKPVALVAGALPSPRVLAMLRRERGKQREQRPTQACAPTEKPALL